MQLRTRLLKFWKYFLFPLTLSLRAPLISGAHNMTCEYERRFYFYFYIYIYIIILIIF